MGKFSTMKCPILQAPFDGEGCQVSKSVLLLRVLIYRENLITGTVYKWDDLDDTSKHEHNDLQTASYQRDTKICRCIFDSMCITCEAYIPYHEKENSTKGILEGVKDAIESGNLSIKISLQYESMCRPLVSCNYPKHRFFIWFQPQQCIKGHTLQLFTVAVKPNSNDSPAYPNQVESWFEALRMKR